MVKKVIHISDVHFRTYRQHTEYKETLTKMVSSIKEMTTDYSRDEIRIVITGDLVHQKITISNELIVIGAWFLRELEKIAKVVLIAGNHDLLEHNKDRLDSITPIVSLLSDLEIEYYKGESNCYLDDNIVWCVYSIFDENKRPNIEEARETYGNDKRYIGLFHAPILNAKTDIGYEFDHGTPLEVFEGLDIAMCGDIHLRQGWNHKGTIVQYAGSAIQQNFGEKVTGHGYLFWDIIDKTFIEKDIDNEYAMYQYKISSIDDIVNNLEIPTNA